MQAPRLTIELVPRTAWGLNLRAILSKDDWDIIRKSVYMKAAYKCQVCTDPGKLEAHEVWEFIGGKIRLKGIVALCGLCHDVKHIGLSMKEGKLNACVNQLLRQNRWTRNQATEYIRSSFETWKVLSEQQWELDLPQISGELSRLGFAAPLPAVWTGEKASAQCQSKESHLTMTGL